MKSVKDSSFTKEQPQAMLAPQEKEILEKIALAVRILSMDAVQRADSGHPGLPLGCAEFGAYLFGNVLRYNPKDPKWAGRDRFILSAGHGSMLLYSLLHLSGYNLSLDDLKQFRQLHSKTPGHPESLDTEGVETTTGPLGQGLGNAVGQALGLKLLAAKFNTGLHTLFGGKVYCLMGDGCVMEGVTSEVSSFAGHLKLNNLIAIYDANHVTLDGPLSESCSENTKKRYEAYGWEVFTVDGNDLNALHSVMKEVQGSQERPRLIIMHTIIGKGSPNKAGTFKVHGSPLGKEEVKATKMALNAPDIEFFVPEGVYQFFQDKLKRSEMRQREWNEMFHAWKEENPLLHLEYIAMEKGSLPADIEAKLKAIAIASPVAGRKASNDVINAIANWLPGLYGGSADLSCSDLTMMKSYSIISSDNFNGRNIKFGVREFGMATMATGLAETGMIIPYVGTFLTFSDYMRNAIRLAALMKVKVVYQFTHDSVFLGEDGPTHQPVEHYAALRAIPNLQVIRPADANEVKMAWMAALKFQGPTAILLSRQNLKTLSCTDVPFAEGLGRGGYILSKEKEKNDFLIIATGSEVDLAFSVMQELEKMGKGVRLVSMPCVELFDLQSKEYQEKIIGGDFKKRISIEAGVEQGWHKMIGRDGIAICMKGFGASAKQKDLEEEFGFTVPAILKRIL